MDPMQSTSKIKDFVDDVYKVEQQKEQLEYDSKTSQIKSAENSDKQLELIRKANELVTQAQESSAQAVNETREAKRHAIWANVIGLLAIIVALVISWQ